jgi:hypothetical protein
MKRIPGIFPIVSAAALAAACGSSLTAPSGAVPARLEFDTHTFGSGNFVDTTASAAMATTSGIEGDRGFGAGSGDRLNSATTSGTGWAGSGNRLDGDATGVSSQTNSASAAGIGWTGGGG